jgi:hypothetical protein
VKLLQGEEIRAARKRFFNLQNKEVSAWTEEEQDNARAVCASYDVAAMLVRTGIASRDVVITTWGASIRKSFILARPLIEQMRAEYGTYWDDLEWLAHQAEPKNE